MDNRQEDIQKNIINENKDQDPFKFKMKILYLQERKNVLIF
jgi:hypothetical protein